MSDDPDRTPMTRTELAMLWDLLGQWQTTRPTANYPGHTLVENLRGLIDAELTERFGG